MMTRTVIVASVLGRISLARTLAIIVEFSCLALFGIFLSSIMSAEVFKRNLRTLTSVAEILSCISEYQFEEDQLSHSLTELLANRQPILDSIHKLKSLRNGFDNMHQESRMLDDRVRTTAMTAARIGQRVLVIEQEMGRVKEAGEHVMQTMDLKVVP